MLDLSAGTLGSVGSCQAPLARRPPYPVQPATGVQTLQQSQVQHVALQYGRHTGGNMAVVMTSEAFGKLPGEVYTGPEEAWALANGYASQAGYVGPGVANVGPSDVGPADELTDAVNREAPGFA